MHKPIQWTAKDIAAERLRDAAPDLLAALKAGRELLRHMRDDRDSFSGDDYEAISGLIESMDAAIRKAKETGEDRDG